MDQSGDSGGGEPVDAEAWLRAALDSYGKTGDRRYLDKAVAVADAVVEMDAFRGLAGEAAAVYWSLGATARIFLGRHDDSQRGLDDAITWCRRALEAAPDDDPNRPRYASNLATILIDRYDRDHDERDLGEALGLFDWALPAMEQAGGQAAPLLHNQGQALRALYDAGHDLAVLERAIGVLRRAAADNSQARAVAGGYHTTLGQALRARARDTSSPRDLAEAVAVLRRADEWTAGTSDHLAAVESLGRALLDESELVPRPVPVIEEAVSCLERALSLAEPETRRWGHHANNLGKALVALYRATGRRAALMRARGLFAAAARLPADAADQAMRVANLVGCLQELHLQTGDISFIDEAIALFRDTAAEVTPDLRHNAGVCLLTRFKRYESAADLDEAIAQFESAARDSPPGSVSRAAATNSLGNALSYRFDLLGRDEDLDAAVSAQADVVRGIRQNPAERGMYRANLGYNLLKRARRRRSAAELDAAIREQEIAVTEVGAGSQERIRALAGLADSLAARDAPGGPGASDADRARQAYREATQAALERLPEQAAGSAISWGEWAAARGSYAEAAEALGLGLRALERLFRVQLTRSQKESWLRDTQAIPVQAGYALARHGDLKGAITALERGRALLLSEALRQDRAELSRLTELGRGDLRDRYETAVTRWNQAARRG